MKLITSKEAFDLGLLKSDDPNCVHIDEKRINGIQCTGSDGSRVEIHEIEGRDMIEILFFRHLNDEYMNLNQVILSKQKAHALINGITQILSK